MYVYLCIYNRYVCVVQDELEGKVWGALSLYFICTLCYVCHVLCYLYFIYIVYFAC